MAFPFLSNFLWVKRKVKANEGHTEKRVFVSSYNGLHSQITSSKEGCISNDTLFCLKKQKNQKTICLILYILLVSHMSALVVCLFKTRKRKDGARGVAFYNTVWLFHAPSRSLCLLNLLLFFIYLLQAYLVFSLVIPSFSDKLHIRSHALKWSVHVIHCLSLMLSFFFFLSFFRTLRIMWPL